MRTVAQPRLDGKTMERGPRLRSSTACAASALVSYTVRQPEELRFGNGSSAEVITRRAADDRAGGGISWPGLMLRTGMEAAVDKDSHLCPGECNIGTRTDRANDPVIDTEPKPPSVQL